MDNNPPYWMYLYDYNLEWLLIHVKKKIDKICHFPYFSTSLYTT